MALFLHIGMPRAASTSIQNLIDSQDNSDNLMLVPQLGKRARKIRYLVNSFEEENKKLLRNLSINDKNSYDNYRDNLLNQIQTSIDKSQSYFISEETLFYFSEEKIRQLKIILENLFEQVVIVVVLRDFDSFIKSAYRQHVGHTTYYRPFFIYKKQFADRNKITNPIKQLNLWSKITGWKKRSLNFESLTEDNILSHLEDLFKFQINTTKKLSLNKSIPEKYLKIKLLINKTVVKHNGTLSPEDNKSLVNIFNKING